MGTTTLHLHKNSRPAHLRRFLMAIFIGMMLSDLSATLFADQDKKSVTVAHLQDLFIFPSKDAPAKTVSFNNARVSAKTAGVITDIKVNVGDNIERGELIALLDCEEYEVSFQRAQADVEAATARLTFARSQLNTANKLSSKKNISQEQHDKRRLDFSVAKAEINQTKAAQQNAQRMVENCQLSAPFSGVVTERIASIGDYATTGTPIVRLLDNKNIEVSANVQQQDLSSLQHAEKLTFFNRQKHFDVQLRTILPNMDSKLRSFEVRLAFENSLAPPGATGRLQWKTSTPYISSEYFVQRENQLGIFLLENGTAHYVPIAGAQKGRPAEVALPGTTEIILDGRYSLNEGDTVRVVHRDTR